MNPGVFMSQNGIHTPASVQLRITGRQDKSLRNRLHRHIATLSVVISGDLLLQVSLLKSARFLLPLTSPGSLSNLRVSKEIGPKCTKHGAQSHLEICQRLGPIISGELKG